MSMPVLDCLSLCIVSVHSHGSKTTCPNFTKISAVISRGGGSVLVLLQRNALRTSESVDDVTLR